MIRRTLAVAALATATLAGGATPAHASPAVPTKDHIASGAMSADIFHGPRTQILNVYAYARHTASPKGNRINAVKGVGSVELKRKGGTSYGCSGGGLVDTGIVAIEMDWKFHDYRNKTVTRSAKIKCENDGWMQTGEIPVPKRGNPVLAPGARWEVRVKIDRGGSVPDIRLADSGTLQRKYK